MMKTVDDKIRFSYSCDSKGGKGREKKVKSESRDCSFYLIKETSLDVHTLHVG